MPAIWVLVAVTLGGSMMGVVGMLIYIPAFSVAYSLIREAVKKRLQNKQIPREKYAFEREDLYEKFVFHCKRVYPAV